MMIVCKVAASFRLGGKGGLPQTVDHTRIWHQALTTVIGPSRLSRRLLKISAI